MRDALEFLSIFLRDGVCNGLDACDEPMGEIQGLPLGQFTAVLATD